MLYQFRIAPIFAQKAIKLGFEHTGRVNSDRYGKRGKHTVRIELKEFRFLPDASLMLIVRTTDNTKARWEFMQYVVADKRLKRWSFMPVQSTSFRRIFRSLHKWSVR